MVFNSFEMDIFSTVLSILKPLFFFKKKSKVSKSETCLNGLSRVRFFFKSLSMNINLNFGYTTHGAVIGLFHTKITCELPSCLVICFTV
jgi:hypothetical protein